MPADPLMWGRGLALADLPSAGNAGRLARVSDNVRGLWMDQGAQWVALSGEFANVKEFGAKGDAATNDATAIQSAIDSIPVAGGTVFLPAGTYRINSPLELKRNLTLIGAGRTATVLDGNDATPLLEAAGSLGSQITHCRIAHLNLKNGTVGFDGDYWINSLMFNVDVQTCTSHGIDLANTWGSLLLDVTTRDHGGRGALIQVGNAMSLLHVFSGGNTSNGIEVRDTQFITMRGLDIENNGGYGVVLAGVQGGEVAGYFEGNGGSNGVGAKIQVELESSASYNTRGIAVGPIYADGLSTSERGVAFQANTTECNFLGGFFDNHTIESLLVQATATGNRIGAFVSADPSRITNNAPLSGATSVADGGTVSHGLGTTPTSVRVTPTVSGEFVSVTALAATTFTVAIKKHDNTAGTTQTIYWEAEV